MSTPRVKVGIVGLRHPHAVRGHEPVSWLDTLEQTPDLSIVAVTEGTPSGRESASRHLPGTPCYADVESMLAAHPDIEAAFVLVPNAESGPTLMQLVERDVHVALDKPGARTSTELAPILPMVESRGLVTAVAYLRRHHPLFQDIRRTVIEERLGRLWMVELRLFTTQVRVRGPENPLFSKEASGGGILHWMGCHMIDLLFYVTGSQPEIVRGMTANLGREAIDVEDAAVAALTLRSGAMATVTTGYMRREGSDLTMKLHCENGTLFADMIDERIDITEWGSHGQKLTETHYAGGSTPRCYGGESGIWFLQAFAQAVQRRRAQGRGGPDASGLATLHDAAAVLRAIESSYGEG